MICDKGGGQNRSCGWRPNLMYSVFMLIPLTLLLTDSPYAALRRLGFLPHARFPTFPAPLHRLPRRAPPWQAPCHLTTRLRRAYAALTPKNRLRLQTCSGCGARGTATVRARRGTMDHIAGHTPLSASCQYLRTVLTPPYVGSSF